MIDPEIISYIRRHSGTYSKEQIRQALVSSGVPPLAVEQAFAEEAATRSAPPAPKPPMKRKGLKVALAVLAAVLAVGFFAVRKVSRMLRSPEFQARLREMSGMRQPAHRAAPSGNGAPRAGGGFQTYITLAWKASSRGEHQEAARLATQALDEPVPETQREQAMKAGLGLRAFSYEKAGALEQALADYRALAELDPGDADAPYGLARVSLAKKDYAGALEAAARMCSLAPGRPEGHAVMGAAFANMKDTTKAVGKYGQAIALGEKQGRAAKEPEQMGNWYFNRGVLLANSGERKRALEDISRAIELAPDEATYRTVRAKLYEAAGKAGQASAERQAAQLLDSKTRGQGPPPELRLGPTLPSLEKR